MSAASNRQNEYFVPRDGIDREVITADICRYLGNDALVRPGTYEADGRAIQGYYITAYRNLTSAMIADLKNDSARWDQERRKHQMGGVRYGDSQYRDQQSRGQSGYPGSGAMSSYDSVPRYPGSDAPGYSGGGTSNPSFQPYGASGGFPGGSQYPQQAGYPSPAADSRYPGASAGAPYGQGFGSHQQTMQDAPYVQGSNFGAQDYRQDVRMQDAPVQSNRGVPQPAYGSASQPGFPYPQAQGSTQTGASYAAQPVDAFYGRASPATNQLGYSTAPPAEQQYEDPTPRPPRAAASSTSTQAQMGNSGSSNAPQRRERSDRDREDRPPSDKYARSSHHHRRG